MGRRSPNLRLAGPCVIVLLLFMIQRIEWVRPKLPAPVTSTSPPRLEREEVESAMSSLQRRHRGALKYLEHNDHLYPGLGRGLGWGLQFGTVQARILGLCYPRETEAIAIRMLEDREPDLYQREFATGVLGVLAIQGNAASESVLLRLASGVDRQLMLQALDTLSKVDRDGKFRTLYLSACKNHILGAFDLGPFWTDQETKETFQRILAENLKKYDNDYYSKEALERIGILESPQKDALLEQLVEGVFPPGAIANSSEFRQRWALAVILRNPTPHTLEVLRRRLDRQEDSFARYTGITQAGPTHPGWTSTTDYDDYLLAFLALGGKLNAVETQRLSYYGYLDDPGGKLAALLSHR